MSTVEPVAQERRNAFLERIADLWRGDWSGRVFDGKDGSSWIVTAVDGDAEALDQLDRDLSEAENAY